MAPILFISYGTIRWHLVNIRRAFEVRTTRELLQKLEGISLSDTVVATPKINLRVAGRSLSFFGAVSPIGKLRNG